MRAIGDYENGTYFIKDITGKEPEVLQSRVKGKTLRSNMFQVQVTKEKVISKLKLTKEEIKDFEHYYARQGDAYLREVINQSSVDDEATSYDGTSNDEFSTTETGND